MTGSTKSGFIRQKQKKVSWANCGLTTTCTGAREAQFSWVLVRPFARPVMWSVRHPKRSQPHKQIPYTEAVND